MKKQFLFVVITLGVLSPLFSQTDYETKETKINSLFWENRSTYVSIGFQKPDLSAFNTELKQRDFPLLDSYYLPIGIGFAGKSRQMLSTFDFYFHNSISKNDIQSTELGYYGFNVSFGYDLLNRNRISIYPLIGVSFDWTTIKLGNKVPDNISFSHSIDSVRNNLELTNVNAGGHIGLGFDYSLPIKKSERDRFVIGVRTGYNYPFLPTKWIVNDQILANGPSIIPNGYYAKLMLGYSFSRQ